MAFGYDAPTIIPEDNPDKFINITISVFFDGTQNNRKNTEARLEFEKGKAGEDFDKTKARTYKDIGNKKDDSYENDYSNVARLFKYYDKKESDATNPVSCVYVEGVGTIKYEKDEIISVATGKDLFYDQRGIKAKLANGWRDVNKTIGILNPDKKRIKTLTIDVFGFSRGAATARSFIHEITKEAKPGYMKTENMVIQEVPPQPAYGEIGAYLKRERIKIDNLIVRFAGLFDSVSSYGLISKENDMAQLNLDAVQKARYILHLTAEDEHRVNFPLIKIQSDGKRKKEFSLPGVHSDIGGCYVDNSREEVTILLDNGPEKKITDEQKRISLDGWYTNDGNSKLELNTLGVLERLKQTAYYAKILDLETLNWIKYELLLSRDHVSNKYSYIPLHIMCDYAMGKYINVKFLESDVKKEFEIPTEDKFKELNKLKDILYDYVLNNGRKLHNYSSDHLIRLIKATRNPSTDIINTSDNLDAIDPDNTTRLKMWKENEEISLEPKDYPDNPELQKMLEDFKLLKEIRYKYLHWSADYGKKGMAPRIKSGRRLRNYFPKA